MHILLREDSKRRQCSKTGRVFHSKWNSVRIKQHKKSTLTGSKLCHADLKMQIHYFSNANCLLDKLFQNLEHVGENNMRALDIYLFIFSLIFIYSMYIYWALRCTRNCSWLGTDWHYKCYVWEHSTSMCYSME